MEAFALDRQLARHNDMVPRLLTNLCDRLECPESGRPLRIVGDKFVVPGSSRSYVTICGIPSFFLPTAHIPGQDVTDIVKEFYEETPFPNYDELDSRQSLASKAKRGAFAAMLAAQIPDDAVVLEAGCGTGQLTNFLGMSWRRRVIGGDLCMNSLRLAEAFRERYSIRNAAFLQMNLFRLPFRDESFDFIISNGVLHHTGNPEAGFAGLVKKLKIGGVISVGLYNSYARLPTLWRRWLFERFGSSMHFLDRRLRMAGGNTARWRAWYMDQYRHPHESRHSMDEVLGWFKDNGVEFLSGIPDPTGQEFFADDRLFESHPAGGRLERTMTQLGMLLAGGADGGLFIMLGRRIR